MNHRSLRFCLCLCFSNTPAPHTSDSERTSVGCGINLKLSGMALTAPCHWPQPAYQGLRPHSEHTQHLPPFCPLPLNLQPTCGGSAPSLRQGFPAGVQGSVHAPEPRAASWAEPPGPSWPACSCLGSIRPLSQRANHCYPFLCVPRHGKVGKHCFEAHKASWDPPDRRPPPSLGCLPQSSWVSHGLLCVLGICCFAIGILPASLPQELEAL